MPDTAHLERDMGCSGPEWRRLLHAALGPYPWQDLGDAARIRLGEGQVVVRWTALPPRVIALVRIPRLKVCFDFEGLDAPTRQAFMKRLDLYTHRGGG